MSDATERPGTPAGRPAPALTGRQRRHLRGLAHRLEPVVQIGRQGLSDAVVAELDRALEAHELVKIRFLELRDEKAALAAAIDERLGAALVGTVGHVASFYRPARQRERRRIELPR